MRRATHYKRELGHSVQDFYPRSPCGERLMEEDFSGYDDAFLSTLSLRRATERVDLLLVSLAFLSTLSLRRATAAASTGLRASRDFYPRSPCGERPRIFCFIRVFSPISIHALLAESDLVVFAVAVLCYIFLSTLSLRRATRRNMPARRGHRDFYPRSPCGERLDNFA